MGREGPEGAVHFQRKPVPSRRANNRESPELHCQIAVGSRAKEMVTTVGWGGVTELP